MTAELVWFKRDLRVHDNGALARACRAGKPVICLYVIEPELWAQPEYSARQYVFLTETLNDLQAALIARGGQLAVRVGAVTDVLDQLHDEIGLSAIHAHEETGLIWTWERDRAVSAWARSKGVAFNETSQHGVVRGLASRNGWAKRWDQLMSLPVTPAPERIETMPVVSDPIPTAEGLGLAPDPCPQRQTGGRRAAIADLKSFFDGRGREYRRAMSSPLTAYDACSRMSAHLALGSLSMRETFQAALRARSARRDAGDGRYAQSIDSFIARLHWHCHFMQKFEDETAMEYRDLHPAYRGARPEPDPDSLARWIDGRTGFPFVDACMRSLDATGWLNFRMRAMVVAFSSYHLWQHWKQPAEALARRFVDFEPGIHYPQFQMQSGTTGVNTPRMYNPVKQGLDQDPDGVFVRRWVPELADLPTSFIHEPWKAPDDLLAKAGVVLGESYPDRIVDHEQAAREARARIGALRKGEDHRAAAAAIQAKHGSRKSGLKQTGSASSRRKARQVEADERQTRFEF
ncbi:DNA photolyase family protein [Maricaulaceae bacterium NA33B04]|nr:DNA photolyase family protein [Maricaulaceae bacterium NA33B04]